MFAAVGLLVTIVLLGLSPHWSAWLRVVATAGAAGALLVLALHGRVQTRGTVSWWDEPLWRDLLLYTTMLVGMMFRVIWDQLELSRRHSSQASRNRRKPRFDFWDFLYPVLPSLAVFQGVLWLAEARSLSLQLLLLSFQNGFFWHTLLGKVKSSADELGAKA